MFTFVALSALAACSNQEAPEPITDPEELMALGGSKARLCVSCHGRQGISRIPANPSLAGLSQEYLSRQLFAFRSGELESPVMTSIALNLSDNDIAALSLYYSSLPAPPNGGEK